MLKREVQVGMLATISQLQTIKLNMSTGFSQINIDIVTTNGSTQRQDMGFE